MCSMQRTLWKSNETNRKKIVSDSYETVQHLVLNLPMRCATWIFCVRRVHCIMMMSSLPRSSKTFWTKVHRYLLSRDFLGTKLEDVTASSIRASTN
jgi:hypothetical protein